MTKKQQVLALIAVGFLIYFNALFNNFVWDDEEQVLNNVYVHSLNNLPYLFSGSTFNTGGAGLSGLYYKPLMSVSFAALYTVFGPNPFYFHLFQLSLHLLNTVLVLLLFRLFFNHGLSFFLALIFLIHPINNEAVIYIASLQDTLFLTFGLLATRIVKSGTLTFLKSITLTLLLLGSLLSKETGALFFPAILVYYKFISQGRRLSWLLAALGTSLAVYAFLRFAVAQVYFHKLNLISPIMTATFGERLLTIPKIVFTYLSGFVLPLNLSISQHWLVTQATWPDFYLPLIFDLMALLLLVYTGWKIFLNHRESFKVFLFFCFWFLIGLGLHLHFFPLDMTLAERWFYFPVIGLLGIIGSVIQSLNFTRVVNKRKDIVMACLVIVFLLLSLRTIIRNTNWQNGFTLYSHDITISQNSFDLENNLGTELARQKHFSEAKPHFEKSISLSPHWWTNWNNLGVVYERAGDYPKAEQYYQQAITNGHYYLAYENLAILYFNQNKYSQAQKFCEQSLLVLPFNARLWQVLALSSTQLKDNTKALEAARKAYLLLPSNANKQLYEDLQKRLP